MVLEMEIWHKMLDTVQIISLAGLVGDGAPLIVPTDGDRAKISVLHSKKLPGLVETGNQKNGFANWLKTGNPFSLKLTFSHKDSSNPLLQQPCRCMCHQSWQVLYLCLINSRWRDF